MNVASGLTVVVSVSTRQGKRMGDELPSVAFISGDWNNQVDPPEANGCAYYRQVLPCRLLEGMGFDAMVGQPKPHEPMGIGLAKDDGALFGFDISVYKLMMHASVPQLFHVMQAKGETVAIDIDDFHFDMHAENIAHAATPSVSSTQACATCSLALGEASVFAICAACCNVFGSCINAVNCCVNASCIDSFWRTIHDAPASAKKRAL